MEAKVSLGLKLFKENEDGSIDLIRIIKLKKNDSFVIKNCKTGETMKCGTTLISMYTPLEPDGILTASVVSIGDENTQSKDVILTANKYIETKMKLSPYVICRQSISDIFAELFCEKETNDLVGLSVTRDNCPTNFDMKIMLAADEIIHHQLINIYRMDTLDDIYEMLDKKEYNQVLNELYTEHCKYSNNPMASMKDEDMGWCRNIRKLIESNNFWNDINSMFNILEVGFTLSDYFETRELPGNKDIKYNVLRDDARLWLSSIYKANITEANILEYDHDVNMANFKDTNNILIRDITHKLYLVVYIVNGEFLEKDLEEKAKEMDFSTKFKLEFYNKYKQINDNSI
ncbi:MAG: hypothetical protein IKR19_08195 [Acholeplasmatales bacterium]|nr:hypothetical protein [Acholeplasmatales bacterium]